MIVFFFNGTATTEIYTYRHTLSLHDALPISWGTPRWARRTSPRSGPGPTPSARQPRQRPPRPPSRHARPRPSADRPGGFEEPERRHGGVLFFGFFASDSPARPDTPKRTAIRSPSCRARVCLSGDKPGVTVSINETPRDIRVPNLLHIN